MSDLGNRTNVNTAINLLLDDAQPNEAIQPSDHNTLLQNILDTLANGLSVTLRTNPETGGQDIEITSGDKLKYKSSTFFSSLITDTLTADRTLTLPNKTDTIATLTDVQNIMNTNGLTLGGDYTHDLNSNNLVFDDGSFRLTNGSLGVLGSFNATHDGATGQDVATFISSSTNPIMVLSNTYEAVAIGTTGPSISAILDIESTSKGVLFPRMTTTQRNAISTPAESMFIYNTTTEQFEFRASGGTWDALGGGGDSIYTADGTVSTNRSVNFSDKFLTFDNLQVFDLDAGSTSAFVMRINAGSNSISNASKIELYESSIYPGYAKSLIFRARKNEGSIKQLAYTNSTHGFYLTSGYSATTDFTNINRRFEIGNNLTFFQNTNLVIAPNVTTGTPTLVGTEDISLQGHTIIKGEGTTTGTTLALYDNQGTPAKTWEWLDNGNVNLGIDTVITLNNTLKIESGQTYLDNGSFNPLVINRKSSGVSGVGIDFNAYNSSNVETNFARIVQVATDATAGSEDGGLWFRTMIAGTLRTPVILDNREFLIDAVNFTDNGFRIKYGITDCLKVTTSKQTYVESGNFNPLVINRKSSGVNGVGLDLNAYNSSNAEYNFARIVQVSTDVTAGSEDGSLWLRVSNNGTITTKMIIKSNTINMPNLPTSSAGLSSGDIYNDGGTLKIV